MAWTSFLNPPLAEIDGKQKQAHINLFNIQKLEIESFFVCVCAVSSFTGSRW